MQQAHAHTELVKIAQAYFFLRLCDILTQKTAMNAKRTPLSPATGSGGSGGERPNVEIDAQQRAETTGAAAATEKTLSGLDMFGNENVKTRATRQQPVTRKADKKRRRTRHSSSLSTFSENSDADDVQQQENNSGTPPSWQERVDMLARGETSFVGAGSIARPMRKAAEQQRRKWDQIPLKQANRMLTSLAADLQRKRQPEAAGNIEAVQAVVEHLHYLSCESSHMTPMLEEAAADVLRVALDHSTEAHGAPALWAIVLKHVLAQLADITKRLEVFEHGPGPAVASGPSARSNTPKRDKREAPRRREESRKRLCRNCLTANPPQRVWHTTKECQRAGNMCNILCTICGTGKHFEDQCNRTSFAKAEAE